MHHGSEKHPQTDGACCCGNVRVMSGGWSVGRLSIPCLGRGSRFERRPEIPPYIDHVVGTSCDFLFAVVNYVDSGVRMSQLSRQVTGGREFSLWLPLPETSLGTRLCAFGGCEGQLCLLVRSVVEWTSVAILTSTLETVSVGICKRWTSRQQPQPLFHCILEGW